MSARIYAEITIGGTLDAQTRHALAEAILEDQPNETQTMRPLVRIDSTLDNEDVVLCAIDGAIERGESLSLYDDSCDGEFAAIEIFCNATPNLRYYRLAKPHDDFNGEIAYYDGKVLHEADCDGGGGVVVPLDVLKRAIADHAVTSLVASFDPLLADIPPLTVGDAQSTVPTFNCDGPCGRRNLPGPPVATRVRFSRATGKRFDKNLCSEECTAAYDAEEQKLDHYQSCTSQDDMRDPTCSECVQLNIDVARLRRIAKAHAGAPA